ncbi:hypothetical protein J1N35_036450, partial [Gossypium stocksii]
IGASWDTVLDGLYYQRILQALQEYKGDIPDLLNGPKSIQCTAAKLRWKE